MLWPTVSRPACVDVKHPFGTYDQIFISVKKLRICSCGAPLWREDGSVFAMYYVQYIYILHEYIYTIRHSRLSTADHALYLVASAYEFWWLFCFMRLETIYVMASRHGPNRNSLFHYCVFARCRGKVSTELFPSNGCCTVSYLHSC
jgi:hypothetical protein